jgi:hypothetical protein
MLSAKSVTISGDPAGSAIIVQLPEVGASRILSNVSHYTYIRLPDIPAWKTAATDMTISYHIYKVYITICSPLNTSKCDVGF